MEGNGTVCKRWTFGIHKDKIMITKSRLRKILRKHYGRCDGYCVSEIMSFMDEKKEVVSDTNAESTPIYNSDTEKVLDEFIGFALDNEGHDATFQYLENCKGSFIKYLKDS